MRDVYADTPESGRYAGFWIRVGANALDALMLAALNMAAHLAMGAWAQFSDPGPGIGSASVGYDETLLALGAVLPPVVIIACWIALGATPGKLMLGLRIVDEPTGGRPSPWQCVGRYFMALIAVACVGVGYAWIAIDPRRQGWHDKIVRTLVVRRG
jgi:uncharacterized RDD family membrane protein YckC